MLDRSTLNDGAFYWIRWHTTLTVGQYNSDMYPTDGRRAQPWFDVVGHDDMISVEKVEVIREIDPPK